MLSKSFALIISILATLVSSKKIFIDNDGMSVNQLLIPLYAGYEIVGLSMSFGSSSVVDSLGSCYTLLENYNLTSCIPLYKGAENPLIQTNDTFHLHEDLFGELVWQGAFSTSYTDSYNYSSIVYNETLPGALALIEKVKMYKDTDPVVIMAEGMMTTVAQALSIYPQLVNESAGLWIMGGYVDNQYAQTTGDAKTIDVNTDINLLQDPEAAQIALTASWKELMIGGNVTNYLVPSQEFYDRIIDRAGGLSVIEDTPYFKPIENVIGTGNYTENGPDANYPYWGEVVAASIGYPDLIKHTTSTKCAVDTGFYSPFYGYLRIWNKDWAPTSGVRTGDCTMIDVVDYDPIYDMMIDILFSDWRQYCETGNYTGLAGYS